MRNPEEDVDDVDVSSGSLTTLDKIVKGEYQLTGESELYLLREQSLGTLLRQDYVLQADYGKAFFSITKGNHFKLDWGSYQFRKGLNWTGRVDEPIIELHCQLDGYARSIDNSLGGPINIEPGDHTLYYIPSVEGHFKLNEDSKGSVFEVRLTTSYFLNLAERYPDHFGVFADRIDRQQPFWIDRWRQQMTPAMWSAIAQIRKESREGPMNDILIEAHILKLLALQVQQRSPGIVRSQSQELTQPDKDKMFEARALLLSRFDDPPSIAELARQVGTNEFKLKRGFRALFNDSPYAVLLSHKMEMARSMVLDTELSISEIAYRIGYRDPAHFTHAFRKHFNCRPSDLRKDRNQGVFAA